MTAPQTAPTAPAASRLATLPRGTFALVAFVAAAWFLTLGLRHLLPSDEGRYAEIAREMYASGDWVTIRYNGVKYFEKPPLHLWMTAIAYHLFGVGEWQSRLWVAISGAIGILATMVAAKRWYGERVALLAGLVLLAAPTWNIAAHFNSLDMSVSGALACVLASVLMAQHPDASAAQRRHWMWAAWAAMAAAVLTKGLIGLVLPGLVLFVYVLLARDWMLLRRLHAGSGSLLFLVIVVPWFVIVSLRNPEFPSFFFIHEHWQRYTTNVHHRGAPWWYFVPQLLVGFVPWLALSWPMARAVRKDLGGEGFRPALLLGVWAAVIFVFFSLSGSKLPGYIVPIFPALALLAAPVLSSIDAKAWRRQIVLTALIVAITLAATPFVARLGSTGTPNELYRSYAVWMAGALALSLGGLALAFRLRHSAGLRSFGVYSVTLFAAITVALLGHETFGRKSSGVDLAAPIQKVLTPGMPIYSVRMLDHTLPFYLRRATTMVESADELEFGLTQEPQKWLPSLDAFENAWASGPPAIAIMSPATHALLERGKVAMVPLARDARRVVVTNFPQRQP